MSVVLQTGVVLASGAMVAAAAVPALNQMFLGDVRQDWLCRQVEFDSVAADGVTINMKSGRYCRVVRVGGVSYDAMMSDEIQVLSNTRCEAFARLAAAGIIVRLFAVKRRADLLYEGDWPEGGIAEIGAAEEDRFRKTFSIGWFALLDSGNNEVLRKQSESFLDLMQKHDASFLTGAPGDMDAASAAAPRQAAAGLDCGLAEFANYLMTGDMSRDVDWITSDLSRQLGNSNIRVDENGDIWTATPTRRLHRVIAVRRWPEEVSGKLLGDLLRLPVEIEVSQIVVPESKTKAQFMFDQKANEMSRLSMFGGQTRAEDFRVAVDVLAEENVQPVRTEFAVYLRASGAGQMERAEAMVFETLGRHKVIANSETAAAGILWFNRMPGSKRRSGRTLRPLRLMTPNLGAIWPFHSMTAGNPGSPWGDQPVRLFTGSSGQSYSFQFHASAAPQSVGHYLVLAPTGGGKTTLMMHLLSGLAKFRDVRSYVFDSREGARFTIEALGGSYHSFDSLSLNPLDVEDSPAARHRISMIVRSMLDTHAKDDETGEIVDQLLSVAFKTTRHKNRTFNDIFPLAFPSSSAIKRAFLPWVRDTKGNKGIYSHIFNAASDSLADTLGASQITGINMNEALADPALGPPVVAHIMNKISDTASNLAGGGSGGFNIFIDEAAKLLENAGFRSAVVEMYREYRKLNGVVGMAFQDPAALHKSGIAEAVIDNTSTLIIFPNPLARKEDYANFNLNEEQLAFITAHHQGRKVLVVRRDGPSGLDETVVLDADLGWLGDAMRFYRSGPDAVKHIERLQRDNPENWRALV